MVKNISGKNWGSYFHHFCLNVLPTFICFQKRSFTSSSEKEIGHRDVTGAFLECEPVVRQDGFSSHVITLLTTEGLIHKYLRTREIVTIIFSKNVTILNFWVAIFYLGVISVNLHGTTRRNYPSTFPVFTKLPTGSLVHLSPVKLSAKNNEYMNRHEPR